MRRQRDESATVWAQFGDNLLTRWEDLPQAARARLLFQAHPERYLAGLSLLHPALGRVPCRLYPYQLALLRSQGPQRLVVKARQVGVSQLIAAEALHRARFFPGSTALFVSRNLAAAQHLQRLVYQLLESDPAAPVLRRSDSELVLANESTIRSLPASESTGRTYAATGAYLDEFAHARSAEAIYQAVAPTASRGGRLLVASTPRGKANLFYRLYYEATLGLNSFEIHRIHWADCPEYNPQGYQEPDPARRLRLGEQGAWFAQNRDRYSDAAWAEEYECDFAASVGLVYREFDPSLHVVDYQYRPEWTTIAGQDFGYIHPAVCLLAQVSPSDDLFVFAEHYQAGVPISTLARDHYLPLAREYRVAAWYCDPSDPGAISELRAAGLPALPARAEVARGLMLVRKLLRPPGGEAPRLHLSRQCRQLSADLATYAYREGSEEPEKGLADHGPDALRYLVRSCWAGQAEAEAVALGA